MLQLSPQETERLTRYHGQSVRLLRDAMNEAREGRWLRCEELLWGSATLAVKGVALSRGNGVDNRASVEGYAQALGRESNDRRIRDIFTRLGSFADVADRVRESRAEGRRLVAILEDVTSAVERMWDMLPLEKNEPENSDAQDYHDEPSHRTERRSGRPRRPRSRRTDRRDDE